MYYLVIFNNGNRDSGYIESLHGLLNQIVYIVGGYSLRKKIQVIKKQDSCCKKQSG